MEENQTPQVEVTKTEQTVEKLPEAQEPKTEEIEIVTEQPQQKAKNGTDEIVIPVVAAPNPGTEKKKEVGRGVTIATIVCGVLGIIFAILAFVCISPFVKTIAYAETEEGAMLLGILMFFFYMFTFGLVSWVPSLGLSIASMCTSVKTWSSKKKGVKATGIIFFITSLLSLLALIAVLILFMIPGSVSMFVK